MTFRERGIACVAIGLRLCVFVMADKKTRVLAIRISDGDQAALEADAKRRGLPLATLARDLLLARQGSENGVKALESANTRNLVVYHIDDLQDDGLRAHTTSLRT